MSNSIVYLTTRSNFLQVSSEVPVTKSRNVEKYDPPDVFDGTVTDKPCGSELMSMHSKQKGARQRLDY